MASYKILINDRNYQDWSLVDALSLNETEKIDIEPVKSKLFSSDVFELHDKKCPIFLYFQPSWDLQKPKRVELSSIHYISLISFSSS